MMKLDPSEEDSDDSGNNGGRESPTGEAGQVVDLEVCHSTPASANSPSFCAEIVGASRSIVEPPSRIIGRATSGERPKLL